MSGEREDIHEPDVDEVEIEAEADDETQDQPEPEQEQPDPELVELARKYGWRPKEEFDRDPSGWVDAKRFMELPATHLKIIRDQKRETERELKATRESVAKMERMAQGVAARVRQQERERYEAELAALREQQRKAVQIADVETFDALERQADQVRKRTYQPEPQQDPAANDPEFKEYVDSAAWVNHPQAVRIAYQAIENDPFARALAPVDQVKWAERRVKEYMPHLFEVQQAPQPQAPQRAARVDGGGLAGGRKADPVAKLTAEERQVGEMYVKEGVYSSLAEYAKDLQEY